jgi:serine/threonine protein kinase/WD40 repeat protein
MNHCPSGEDLDRFLVMGLDQPSLEAVAAHIDGCPACQERLDRMMADEFSATKNFPGFPGRSVTNALDGLEGDADKHPRMSHEAVGFGPTGSERSQALCAGGECTKSPMSRMPLPQEQAAHLSSSNWPRLPDYEVLGVLGRGAMGVVYRARQISLNRLVAVKMVLAGAGASELHISRFRIEAEAVARLQHANIVQIFAIGDHDGLPYMVLELVEGQTLAQRLNSTPQRPESAAALVEALARAMHSAHDQGVVHRDLKPSNILLKTVVTTGNAPSDDAPSDIKDRVAVPGQSSSADSWKERLARTPTQEIEDYGVPKIVDFGLARLLDSKGRMTRTGDLMGTPCYISPEQAMAASHLSGPKNAVSAATDVYALGAILYEMITGRPPFEAETTMKTLLMVLHEDPISPSELRPKVPHDLTTICLKCLEKEPSQRYGSAQDLAEDLRRFRDGEPILARRVGTIGLAWRWCRRRPVVAGMSVALAVSLLGGLLGTTALWLRADSHHQLAEHHRRLAEENFELSESNLYFSRITQAQLEWRLNNPAAAISVLNQCVPAPGAADRRGWEWHYLKNLTHADIVTLANDTSPTMFVSSVHFSADGRYLFEAGGTPLKQPKSTGEVVAWDFLPGEQKGKPAFIRAVRDGLDFVLTLTSSHDGKVVAVGEMDGTVKVFSDELVSKPRVVARLTSPITSISLSPDGRRLAAADAAGRATVVDIQTGITQYRLDGVHVRFAPDGRQLFTGGTSSVNQEEGVFAWDAANGARLRTIPVATSGLEISPDGQMLLIWHSSEARMLNALTGKSIAVFAGNSGDVLGAAISPDGLHVATAGADRTVRVWNARTGREELVFRGHLDRVQTVAFHPCGRYLASADYARGRVKIWDLTRHPEHLMGLGIPPVPSEWRKTTAYPTAHAMTFTSDSRRLVELRLDGTLRLEDARGGPGTNSVGFLPVLGQLMVPATLARFSGDGGRLAGVDQSNPRRVTVWNSTDLVPSMSCELDLPVYCVAWSRNGKRLVTAGLDWKQTRRERQVKVWDVATGTPIASFHPSGLPDPTRAGLYGLAALCPDGDRVAFDDYTTDGLSHVRVCDVSTGAQVRVFGGHDSPIRTLEFSSTGRLLASGTLNGRVMIHDLTEKGSLDGKAIEGPSTALGMVAFSPDDRLLALIDRDQVQVWHIPTAERVIVLRGAPPRRGDNAFNPRVAWSPDGRLLAALNHNNTVAIWDGTETDDADHSGNPDGTSRMGRMLSGKQNPAMQQSFT